MKTLSDLNKQANSFSETADGLKKTFATLVMEKDRISAQLYPDHRFSEGKKPVVRWIKGDGLDDMITRAAIGQATRIFGNQVDYCLCTQGIHASRARKILEWAVQPVEWWPVTENDNPQLADFLQKADCTVENFGYWWKWFPERVRPDAPEWILDGDMVITGKPDWFQLWVDGKDVLRLSQDDAESPLIYGRYANLVDTELMFYSGLVSLPGGVRYMSALAEVMDEQPLSSGHNGKKDMDEQGVIAATFQKLHAVPIPLYEFPFCRAYQNYIDYGLQGDQGKAWGYHFGNSFRRANPHFDSLTAAKKIFSQHKTPINEKFRWLQNYGQWGIPGWSVGDDLAKVIMKELASFKGKNILEVGTSRGYISAILATSGIYVTTVDCIDRGAGHNLQGLPIQVVVDDFVNFITTSTQHFEAIIIDVHCNSPADWKRYAQPVIDRLEKGSTLIISNYKLNEIMPWQDESGVKWFLEQLHGRWKVRLIENTIPCIAIVSKFRKMEILFRYILSKLSS